MTAVMNADSRLEGVLALRYLDDADRYGVVTMADERVTSFGEKLQAGGPGLINGGVYLFRRAIADHCPEQGSLEVDVLPRLVKKGVIGGVRHDGFFLDIGIEEAFEQAQSQLPKHRHRPAIFLDRDGVLNYDHGHVGRTDAFEWNEGAREAIRTFNDLGWYVFVVTNQAGIAKGKYSLADYWTLRDHIRADLAMFGCQIDDERFCPYHPDGSIPQWRSRSNWRKPEPGMLIDLFQKWPVQQEMSFLIGDQETDIEAATAAGLPGFKYRQGSLERFALQCLDAVKARVKDNR
jgi:D-glycero-D-manno-heptose 1,7-bisphosphate phosphatase